jgi:hypothetical protein
VLKAIRRFYAPLMIVPPRWYRYAKSRELSTAKKYSWVNAQALLTWHSVLPLVSWRGLLRRLWRYADGGLLLYSAMAGGIIDGISPVAPTLHFRHRQNGPDTAIPQKGLPAFAPHQEQA